MYKSFFKTIELSMQPVFGMAEINRLAVERIAHQQTECFGDCIRAGMKQLHACTDLDDCRSLADMQFEYLKLYEQQLSLTAESNMQTLNQASKVLQKVMGANLDQFSGNNPLMALMADLGLSYSASPFFDWFKESVAANQSVAETVTQNAASPAAAKPFSPADNPMAKPKAASRASAPSNSHIESTVSSGISSKSTAGKHTPNKNTPNKNNPNKNNPNNSTSSTPSNAGNSAATSRSGANTTNGKTSTGESTPSDKASAASATSAKSSTPQRATAPVKNDPKNNTRN